MSTVPGTDRANPMSPREGLAAPPRRAGQASLPGRDKKRDQNLRRSGQLRQLQADRLKAKQQVEGQVSRVRHPSNAMVAGSIPAGRALIRDYVLVHAFRIMLVVRNRMYRSPDPDRRAQGSAPPPDTHAHREVRL